MSKHSAAKKGPSPEQQKVNDERQARIVEMLEQFLQRAKDGKLSALVLAFQTTTGVADVFSSPMNPLMICHLLKIFERRVDATYDRFQQGRDNANKPAASPTAPVPQTQAGASGKPLAKTAQLPRNVRRQVSKAQRKIEKMAKAKGYKPPEAQEGTLKVPSDPLGLGQGETKQ